MLEGIDAGRAARPIRTHRPGARGSHLDQRQAVKIRVAGGVLESQGPARIGERKGGKGKAGGECGRQKRAAIHGHPSLWTILYTI